MPGGQGRCCHACRHPDLGSPNTVDIATRHVRPGTTSYLLQHAERRFEAKFEHAAALHACRRPAAGHLLHLLLVKAAVAGNHRPILAAVCKDGEVGGGVVGVSGRTWLAQRTCACRCCILPGVAFRRWHVLSWLRQSRHEDNFTGTSAHVASVHSPQRQATSFAPVSSTYGASPSRSPAAGTTSPPCLREMDLSSSMAISECLGLPIT